MQASRTRTIRFSGAYNDAYYADFPNLAQPVENGYPGAPPYRDASGENLPGSFKYAFNLGVDYRVPFSETLEFRTTATPPGRTSSTATSHCPAMRGFPIARSWTSRWAVGTRSGSFDASLLLKNAFDDNTHVAQTWNSYGPAFPRWWGVVFSGKL